MYQFYNNTLTIPGRMLYEDLGIMTKSNYDKQCRSGKINKVVTARGLGNFARIEFESIPERFRVEVVKKLGYPPKKEVQSQILQHYKTDYEAIDFYATFKLDEHRNLSPEKQEELVINAQMLQALDIYLKNMASYRKARNGSTVKIWETANQAIKEVKEQTGHTLPTAERRLREKLANFKKDGYKTLISEKFGNQTASKIKDSQQEATLRQLLRDHRNLDNEQIALIYNSVAIAQKWPEITGSTVGNYRTKWNLLTYGGTKGEKAFDNYVGMTVKRKAPSSAMLYWTVDGWDVELFYQTKENPFNRLTMVVVLDPSVKYPIGYAIGNAETTDLIKAALRNAVLHTEELLGAKHKVLQIQTDNYGKKTMKPIYEGISNYYTPAKVGNAKSKVIEPWFEYFNRNYCQFAYNWSGCGVKSKKQPNPDFLNKIKNSFPDEQGCRIQLMRMMEMAREAKKEEFLESYQTLQDDARKLVTEKEFLLYFGENTGFTNRLSHAGIVSTIFGTKHYYDCFEVDFRKNSHLDWQIKFNPEDLSQVLAYNEDKNISFLLQEKHLQPMAIYDQQEGDRAKRTEISDFNKEIKTISIETQTEDLKTIDNMFNENRALEDTLAKAVLINNRGQHKDVKNANRLKSAQKVLEKQENADQKQIEKTWETERAEYLSNKIDFNKYL